MMSGIFKILKYGKTSGRHLGLPDETIEIDATDINYVFTLVNSIERIADSIAKKDKREQRKAITKEEYLVSLKRLCQEKADLVQLLLGFSDIEQIRAKDSIAESIEHEFDAQLATLAARYFDEENGMEEGGT